MNRIRATLPARAEDLGADRTAREIVILNLFVALQECVALATTWAKLPGFHTGGIGRQT